jgi:hypothetical protein
MGMKNKKKSMVDERKEAEERKRMKRLAEEHQGMLGYYIRLIDYTTIETLVNTLDKSVSKFYSEMITRKTRLFFTTVKYGKDSMQFNPD